MRQCPHCGHRIAQEVVFCNFCTKDTTVQDIPKREQPDNTFPMKAPLTYNEIVQQTAIEKGLVARQQLNEAVQTIDDGSNLSLALVRVGLITEPQAEILSKHCRSVLVEQVDQVGSEAQRRMFLTEDQHELAKQKFMDSLDTYSTVSYDCYLVDQGIITDSQKNILSSGFRTDKQKVTSNSNISTTNNNRAGTSKHSGNSNNNSNQKDVPLSRDAIEQVAMVNTAHYSNIMHDLAPNGTAVWKLSWNWGAFLFTHNWLLYRKMYVEFVIALVACAIAVSTVLLLVPYWLFFGFYGNAMYYKSIQSKWNAIANEAKVKRIPPEETLSYSYGRGVHFWAIPVCVILNILIVTTVVVGAIAGN